jgi:CheY-like chemotaxis protein
MRALARDVAPAVIVLDVELPYRSGLDLLPQLRADPKTAAIPIVVLTSLPRIFSPPGQAVDVPLVSKPCHASALRAALRAARASRAALPVVQASVVGPTGVPEARGAAGTSRPTTPPRAGRVLVVDDDPRITAIVAAALVLDGYTVEAASDGAAALGLLAARRPDAPAVILLDMQMPGMDAADFARRYRGTPAPHAPLICLTASEGGGEQCRAVGADDFLNKPFTLHDLRAVVGRHANHAA